MLRRRNVIGAWVVAVEEIEELDERNEGPTLAKMDRPTHSQVNLDIRSSPKFIQVGRNAVHYRAVVKAIAEAGDRSGSSQRKRPGAFRLRESS